MTRTFKFVRWPDVPDYLAMGWVMAFDLGPRHGEWSVGMQWLCECKPAVKV